VNQELRNHYKEDCSMRRSWFYFGVGIVDDARKRVCIREEVPFKGRIVAHSCQTRRAALQPGRAFSPCKTGRKTYAVRGKRGRRLARSRGRSRRGKYEPQAVIASGSPRVSPGIPAERVMEIQTALIKAGYMDGPASGLYDDATIDAMKQCQAKNGITTGLPSARCSRSWGPEAQQRRVRGSSQQGERD
jgi:hypothetical protein